MKNFNHREHREHGVKDIKPALRELAARSQSLTEFAMVRDASGRYVEVEDGGGMGVGTALKVGAGAAALGGAGYGAYRGHNAVMDKFGGPMEAGKNRFVEAYKGAGAAGWSAAKAGGSAGLDSLRSAGQGAMNSAQAAGAAVGNAAKSGMSAAKKSGLGRRIRGVLVGAARWMK